jgi:hypothetical protein
MKTLALALILLFTPLLAEATTIRPVPLAELYSESTMVVSGNIVSGTELPDKCGVTYQARVEASFKGGAKPGELVTFRHYGPMQIGGKYFLFLGTLDEEVTGITSTNSGFLDRRAQFIKRCRARWPRYETNLAGDGALPITGTYNAAVKRGVIFDPFRVMPAKDLKTVQLTPLDRYDNDDRDNAFEFEAFNRYLQSLSKNKAKQ